MLTQWSLFEARTTTHLDEYAPVITGRTEPDPRGEAWQEMYHYFAEKMGEVLVRKSRSFEDVSRRGGIGTGPVAKPPPQNFDI